MQSSLCRALVCVVVCALAAPAAAVACGDIVIDGEFNADVYSQCTMATSVTITSTSVSLVSLPLTAVADSVTIDGSSMLTSVSFPNLSSIGGALSISYNSALLSLALPLLAQAHDLVFVGNTALDVLALPALELVPGSIVIQYNNNFGAVKFTAVSLPSLAAIGDTITVSYNTDLNLLELPSLTQAHDLYFVHLGSLAGVSLPNLQTVPGAVHLESNRGGVELPSLATAGNVLISDLGSFGWLVNLMHLQTFESVTIVDSPAITTFYACNLQLQQQNTQFSPTCPSPAAAPLKLSDVKAAQNKQAAKPRTIAALKALAELKLKLKLQQLRK